MVVEESSSNNGGILTIYQVTKLYLTLSYLTTLYFFTSTKQLSKSPSDNQSVVFIILGILISNSYCFSYFVQQISKNINQN